VTVFCTECGLPAAKSITAYGVRNECCGQWSWGDKPLADAATHDARQRAHDAFDPLWRDGHMSRAEAYQALQWATGLSEKNCHMSKMSKERCQRVIVAVDKIWATLRGDSA
jgi:hypothetical protein